MLRGTRGSVMDMYRQPEKLLETLEVITQQSLESALAMANMAKSPQIFIPMHKGDDSFMGIKQFEKFYWPSYRKLLMGLINEGCVPSPVVDGSYNTRLEYLTDLPRTGVIWTFEKTDIFKAKKILGNTACIAGNVTAAQLYTHTAKQIKDYCKKLIDECGKGGGYMLSLGSSVDKCDPANLRAIVEARDEYGIY
jgi:uroporphyrinogen-III decarboxylase